MPSLDFRWKDGLHRGRDSGIDLGVAEAFTAAGASVAVVSRSAGASTEPPRDSGQRHAAERTASRRRARLGGNGPRAERSARPVRTNRRRRSQELSEIFAPPSGTMSSNAFKAVVEIDLLGTSNVLRTAHPLLRRLAASVVNVSAPLSPEAASNSEILAPTESWCKNIALADAFTRAASVTDEPSQIASMRCAPPSCHARS